MGSARYLLMLVSVAAMLTGALAATNLAIDPYRVRSRAAPSAGQGALDERPGAFWRVAAAVRSNPPRTVILGTSRAQNALRVDHPGFGADDAPVANLALAAASIDQLRLVLVHAHSVSGVRKAIVGLDLESVLGGVRSDFDAAALSGNPDSEPAWLARVRTTLSWSAFMASLTEVRNSGAPVGPNDHDRKLEELGGQRGLFWITEFNNFYARLADLFPRKGGPSMSKSDPRFRQSLVAFRELLRYAHTQGIDLRLFISPVHARYLEWYRRVGWWPLFEDWKRELVAAIAQESRGHPGQSSFPLWDFSGFHPMASEPVPRLGDLTTRMTWYQESSHYSPALGDMVLTRVLGAARFEAIPLHDVRIDDSNIEGHLARLAIEAAGYRAALPGETANVGEMVAYLRRIARTR